MSLFPSVSIPAASVVGRALPKLGRLAAAVVGSVVVGLGAAATVTVVGLWLVRNETGPVATLSPGEVGREVWACVAQLWGVLVALDLVSGRPLVRLVRWLATWSAPVETVLDRARRDGIPPAAPRRLVSCLLTPAQVPDVYARARDEGLPVGIRRDTGDLVLPIDFGVHDGSPARHAKSFFGP
jgi:hypothetical protein